jgi:hypothetical protein
MIAQGGKMDIVEYDEDPKPNSVKYCYMRRKLSPSYVILDNVHLAARASTIAFTRGMSMIASI